MGDTINSICFKENSISWVQAGIDNSQRITIKKVVESPLPFIINYDNIQKPTTALQISNHIKSLANTHELSLQNMRFLLSAKFAIIKKVRVDQYIPQEQYSDLLGTELGSLLTGDIDDYLVYQPDYARDNESNSLKEILVVAIRKDFFTFMKQIAREADLPVNRINLNCFSIDEIYRRFSPNLMGQSLLVNFAERGFEFVISDESNFLNYSYKPYSKSLQNIDQLDEREVFSNFTTIVDRIQHPDTVDLPLYSFSHIFLFGRYLKPGWLNVLKQKFSIPVKLFDPASTTEWQIVSEDDNFMTPEAYRFVEPLSNVF